MLLQHWRATKDRNGNPRRLWVIMDPSSGNIVTVMDEGYRGMAGAAKWASERGVRLVTLPSVDITPACYRAVKKEWCK